MDRAEYVSAVSGGSYIAASYATVSSQLTPETSEPPVYSPGSPEEQHLRNHSTYMAPGFGGVVRLAFQVVFGVAANLALIVATLYVIAISTTAAVVEIYPQFNSTQQTGGLGDIPLWIWLPIAGVATLGTYCAFLVFALRLQQENFRATLEAWTYRLLAVAAIGAFLLIVTPQLVLWSREVKFGGAIETVLGWALPQDGDVGRDQAQNILGTGSIVSLAIVVLGAARTTIARRPTRFAMAAGAIAGPIALLSIYLWFVNGAAPDGVDSNEFYKLVVVFIALALAWFLSDLTQWSLHPFYKRRLSSAFFVRRTVKSDRLTVEEVPYGDPFHLSSIVSSTEDKHGKVPFKLIVCAAANVSNYGVVPPGRAATPLTFTAKKVGGPIVGEIDSTELQNWGTRTARDVTLRAAVAMSGAAVSPSMGKKTKRSVTLLMALFNVRLGVWMPNPLRRGVASSRFEKVLPSFVGATAQQLMGVSANSRTKDDPSKRETLYASATRRRPTPFYLLKEMLGANSIDDRFIYISDGGHYDNLGLVELLRRGCTRIYCLDGGGDPPGTFRALGEAVALARSDLQAEVSIETTSMVPDSETRIATQAFETGTIRYRVSSDGQETDPKDPRYDGKIVYARATLTKDAPRDVLSYAEKTKRFPNHSTADQLFDDQQFEAYRSLGAHCAVSALAGAESESND